MQDDELLLSQPAYLSCSVIRLTQYDKNDEPDHNRARTCRFDPPVTLVHVNRERLPRVDAKGRTVPSRMPGLAAILASYDHPRYGALLDLASLIRHQDPWHVAAEFWAPHEDGWQYTLFPRWRHAPLSTWPYEPTTDLPAHCLGTIDPAPAPWTWPDLCDPGEIPAGVNVVFADVASPPPPGRLPLSPGSVRASGDAVRTLTHIGEDTDCGPLPTSADTSRTPLGLTGSDPVRPDTGGTGRTAPDADSGQGVRFAYQARVPRRLVGAAFAEALTLLARETGADIDRTPPPNIPVRRSGSRRDQSAAAIAAAFDVPDHLIRKDSQP